MTMILSKHNCTRVSVVQFMPENDNALTIKLHGSAGYQSDIEITVFGLPDNAVSALKDAIDNLDQPK